MSDVRGDVGGWSSADASRRAAHARAARLRWVVLMVEAVDGRRPDLQLQRAATAYHEQGLSVGLWTFPHPIARDPEYAVEALERALVGLEAVGVPCAVGETYRVRCRITTSLSGHIDDRTIAIRVEER